MTAFLMIFRRFPTTFRRFPKIFQNCSEGKTNVPEHFPRISKNFRRCPKIAEDFRCYSNEFKYNVKGKLDISVLEVMKTGSANLNSFLCNFSQLPLSN